MSSLAPHRFAGFRTAVFPGALIFAVVAGHPAIAQTANSNAGLEGGQDGLFDAILATPNYKTPVLPDSAVATTPGLEKTAPAPQFTLNVLAPALFNSNAQFLSCGGSKAFEGSPLIRSAGRANCSIRRSGYLAPPALKPSDLSTAPAPLSTTSALPRARSM